MFLEPCLEQGGIVEKQSRSKPKAVVFNSAVFMTADTAVVFEAFDLAQIDSRFLLSKNIFKKEKMHEITQKIIQYTKAKYTLNYNKWHIGLTDDPKMTKKEFETKNKMFVLILKLGLVKTKQKQKEY